MRSVKQWVELCVNDSITFWRCSHRLSGKCIIDNPSVACLVMNPNSVVLHPRVVLRRDVKVWKERQAEQQQGR